MFPLKDNIPTERLPLLTLTLIVLNVASYFLFQKAGLALGDYSSPDFNENLLKFGAIPFELTHPGEQCLGQYGCLDASAASDAARTTLPSTLITPFSAMFMHGSLLHLGGNMLFLWIFGNNVEDAMGPLRFIAFYLLGGLAALLAQVVVDPSSQVPTIGASGAVAGVLGGYILLWPKARVLALIFIVFFVTIVELPALLILGIWFGQQILFGYLDLANPGGGGGGVAYFAHIGGFAFGMLAIKLFAKRDRVKQTPPRGRPAEQAWPA